MNNESPNSGFLEISLLRSQHFSFTKISCEEKLLNTAATKGTYCLYLISGFEETEKFYTNNKRSLDPSENTKQRCLNF